MRANGEILWAKPTARAAIYQSSGSNWPTGIKISTDGYFYNRLEFGGLEMKTQASRHGFITKLSDAVSVPVYTRPVGNFSIYPNPSDGRIKIKGDKIKGNNMVVLNALGQQVHSFEMDQNEKNFDLTWLSPGLYFVQVVGNHEFRTNKFIIE